MTLLRAALVASLVTAGLTGTASSHTKPKHEYGHSSHGYGGTHKNAYPREESTHGHHRSERHGYPRSYRKPPPPPVPGRKQDGRYVLPGGLESVCAGGTPPPCVSAP